MLAVGMACSKLCHHIVLGLLVDGLFSLPPQSQIVNAKGSDSVLVGSVVPLASLVLTMQQVL